MSRSHWIERALPGRPRGALVALLVVLALGFPAAAAGSVGSGRLRVVVTGIPRRSVAALHIHGPGGFSQQLRRSSTLRGLKAGTYRIDVNVVRMARPYRGVSAGSEVFPNKRRLVVRLRRGSARSVTVIYGTVRSARVVVLSAAPITVIGSPYNPRAIVIPKWAAGGMHRGSILAQAPTATLPSGLFNRVTSKHQTGRGVRVALASASLSEAFPALDVHTTVPLRFAWSSWCGGKTRNCRVSSRAAHAASGLSNVDLSFSTPLIPGLLEGSCGAPPTGWSFSPSGQLQPSLTADIHRGFLGLPYGQLSLTLTGTLGFDATIPSAAHCDLTVDGPHAEAVIFIGDVPVPVEGQLNLGISLALAPFSA